jgi:type IV secretion system protein VirD4
LVALAACLYLPKFPALLLLEQQHLPLAWNTYYGYYKALDLPAWAQYAGKIKMAGAAGFGLPMLAWAGLLIPLLRKAQAPRATTPASPAAVTCIRPRVPTRV